MSDIEWQLVDGTLTISGHCEMNSCPWQDRKAEIKRVIINPGVLSIIPSGFAGCNELKYVSLSESVKVIGEDAFKDCINLKDISIDEKTDVTNNAFANCKALADKDGFVIINYILCAYVGEAKVVNAPEAIYAIGKSAFAGNEYIEEVVIPAGILKVDDMAFARCSKLKKATLKSCETTLGKKVFYNCESFQQLAFEN